MKRTLISVAILAVALLGFIVAINLPHTGNNQAATYKATAKVQTPKIYTEQELLTEVNQLRAAKGVAPLTLDARLSESAQWKAQDMADYDYFDHVRDGYHGYQKAAGLDPDCTFASENIEQQGDYYTDSPFKWWVTSKKHNDALLDARYDTTGFGIVNDNGVLIYVEHFCDLP